MANKKYYAVKAGRKTGIFQTWEECRASVDGYAGAVYKGFKALAEAEEYLGQEPGASETKTDGEQTGRSIKDTEVADGNINGAESPGRNERGEELNRNGRHGASGSLSQNSHAAAEPGECPRPGTLLAYVDGSYDHSLKKYAFGCVFILPDGRICTEYGNGDKEQALQHRNVTGEMLGAMYAVRTAMVSGFKKVELRYDYEGIEKWVTGGWRSKTELTRKYAQAMREWGKSIEICFTKVAAHSNVYYNELADKTAKTGLREGQGTPPVRSLFSDL